MAGAAAEARRRSGVREEGAGDGSKEPRWRHPTARRRERQRIRRRRPQEGRICHPRGSRRGAAGTATAYGGGSGGAVLGKAGSAALGGLGDERRARRRPTAADPPP
ncbi:hypothetical protein OsI_12818 [Oryza sativa Indica Group]|uniref:Uncharacterized protein n=1 Tax=Oryza sativa subsp. indica TaxID=39946 RepID=B8ANI5_ORYSI|nr:hypothetical protein OsI_12818 [Oryza sativa Indica Group]